MDHQDIFYKRVGERIRTRRKELGLSQEGLAKGVGLKRPSVCNIEKGRQNILLHTFCDIAETLDVDANALIPEKSGTTSAEMPDLRGYSKEVREFVEAAIKTDGKDDG